MITRNGSAPRHARWLRKIGLSLVLLILPSNIVFLDNVSSSPLVAYALAADSNTV